MCPNNRTLGARQQREDRLGLRQAFHMLDRDADGAIDWHDLTAFFSGCTGLSLSTEEAISMIAMADLDGDGRVSVDEFERIMATQDDCLLMLEQQQTESRMASLRRAFDVLDADKDGQLGRSDLCVAMSMSGQPFSNDYIDAMMRAASRPPLLPLDFDAFSTLMAQV